MGLFRFFGSTPAAELVSDTGNHAQGSKGGSQVVAQAHEPPKFEAVAVLETAGVDKAQRERVERTIELLGAMPADAGPQLRRGIVEASLKAFDISIKAIVEAARAEIVAFEAHITHGNAQLAALRKQSEEQIADLEQEIAGIRERLRVATADQAHLDEATVCARERVQPVLGFFNAAPPLPSHQGKVANDTQMDHPPSIIIDENLMKVG